MTEEERLREAVVKLEDSWLDQALEIARLRRVLDEARALSGYPCTCAECWTERGRHDPHGCIWEESKDLRKAIENLDQPICQYCGTTIPKGCNTCTTCADEKGP